MFRGTACCRKFVGPLAILLALAVARGEEAANEAKLIASKTLPNLVQIHERVYTGGQPDGAKGFAELARMGIRTIVSVDGEPPNVELAETYRLRYVHMPHGYEGISVQRIAELGKTVQSMPGPIYIHCHHGKHRSPAAGAAACIAAGLIPPEMGTGILKLAGTSETYAGLYRSVAASKPLDPAELARLEVAFTARVKPRPMVESMISLEHLHDRLSRELATARVGEAPSTELRETVTLVREQFTELLRRAPHERRGEDWQSRLVESERAAKELERQVHAGPGADRVKWHTSMDGAFQLLSRQCVACHETFRNGKKDGP